jgi:hypothetical protein
MNKECGHSTDVQQAINIVFHFSPSLIYVHLYNITGIDEFDYANRLTMAAFFHGNALRNRDEAERIILFYNRKYDYSRKWKQRLYQFRSIFTWLEKAFDKTDFQYNTIREKYNYYNMRTKQTMFYDGTIRGPNGEKIIYKEFQYNRMTNIMLFRCCVFFFIREHHIFALKNRNLMHFLCFFVVFFFL